MAIKLKDYESGAKYPGDYDADLAALQERLSHLFVANLVHKRSAIVLCEGWDAAGKGGAIQRMTADCDPRAYRVWPIAAPTDEEKAHHYLWRFWTRMPGAGEIAIFDRSWYGRVLVERVEGFADKAEWRRAYDEINELEAQLAAAGTIIVKLFFHVTQEEQDKRLGSPARPSLEALEGQCRGHPQPRAARRLSRRDQGDVRRDRHALGAVDGDRRQQQEIRPDRRSDPGRRRAGRGAAERAAAGKPGTGEAGEEAGEGLMFPGESRGPGLPPAPLGPGLRRGTHGASG